MTTIALVRQRLRWHLQRVWAGCGTLDLLALALLALWAGLSWQVNHPLQQHLASLSADVATQQLRLHQQARQPAKDAPAADTVSRFIQFLPAASERESALKTLHELATQGLTLGRIDYHGEALADLPASRLTLRFALQGRYADLRQFLRNLQVQLPSLAITRISLDKGDKLPDYMALSVEASLYLQTSQTP